MPINSNEIILFVPCHQGLLSKNLLQATHASTTTSRFSQIELTQKSGQKPVLH